MDGYVYQFPVPITVAGTPSTTTNYYNMIDLIGQNYAFKSGDTFYVYAYRTDGSVAWLNGTISGTPSLVTEIDGTLATRLVLTAPIESSAGTPMWKKYSVLIATKMYVADPTWLTNSYPINLNVGSSTRQIQSWNVGSSGDAIYGNYGSITASGQIGLPPLPAFPGTLVSWQNTTLSHPDTQSPLAYYGSILYTQTVDQSITQSDLDVYASQALVNKSFYLRKASVTAKLVMDFVAPGCRGVYQTFDPRMVMEGELITVLTSANLSPGNNDSATWPDGQYVNRWQVMSWSLDGSTMQVICELGDYEKNTYTLLQQLTSSTNQTLT
jgi:hypothetical protein